MPPPIRLITIASTRNCSSTSRPLAPMAMRMPISRVRSVTDTSMMFMMPMPPTISDTAGDAGQQVRERLDECGPDVGDLLLRPDREIVRVAGDELVLRCA